ncbi:hypothetical protein ABG067_008296, partial [Albugo candida]
MSDLNNNANNNENAAPVDVDVESEQEMFPVMNGNEERARAFLNGFNLSFSVNTVFESMDDLREKAVDFGKKYNVLITTLTSSAKEGKITLHCKHGHSYRAAKK